MDCSPTGFSVRHQHPELAQTHVHWVNDAIQPSHSLLSTSEQWVIFCTRCPKYWSYSFSISPSNEYSGLISFRKFPLGLTDWISLQSKGLSRDFSNTTVQISILRTAIWPSNPTAGHTHWGNQNWRRHVYPNVHCNTVYNSQDMEAT